MDNQTNGAIANYNFDIVPTQKIMSNGSKLLMNLHTHKILIQ